MDGDAFREQVETAKATELKRLGSEKLLVALTDASLERADVMHVAAASEHAARETFREWAETESDEGAKAAFEAVADQEAAHLRRVREAMEADWTPAGDAGPMHAYLRGREGTVPRIAGGMVGRPLVSIRTHNQVIGFFVNEADAKRADLFRDLKAETAAVVDDGLALLEERCTEEDDWEAARGVAEYVIQVAYDDYADALQGMGLDPKPLC